MLRETIEQLVSRGTVTARADGAVHRLFPVAIDPAEGERLRAWVARERARSSIEIGLGYALSTLYICDGLGAGGRHTAIDPHQGTRFGGCGLQVLEDAGVRARVTIHERPSELVLPELLERGERFDFAFVDGNHRYDGVFVDLFYLARLLVPGAAVFLDDWQLPGVRRAVSFFESNLGWTVVDERSEGELHRWAVVRTARAPDRRPFDAFVDF